MKDDRVDLQHIRDPLQDIADYCGHDPTLRVAIDVLLKDS
jgi:hypothetical protein